MIEFYNSEDVRTLRISSDDKIAVEIMDLRRFWYQAIGTQPDQLFLGPIEYLRLCGYCANLELPRSAQVFAYVDTFMGMEVYLKSSPGMDAGFKNREEMALRLAHTLIKPEKKGGE
jgi:hypothetical protein